MDGISLIQDLAVVLLAASAAAAICRRIGLSVIVGYLFAGIVIGPYTPPFALVSDVNRIQTLSQVGLVFLMFGIGLGLSLSKLGRMGWPTLLATGLGAFFVFMLTRALGHFVGWNSAQSLFIAAMFMVSSSAVIAKVLDELNLSHDRSGQVALSITVLEDVVAVVMLTLLAARTSGGDANVGSLLTSMSAFVVLLVGVGLLMVPRLLRRLEARADPEILTITVAGVLFLLSIAAVKAGYSLALGAFLLGAIVAEIPQRAPVEKAFAGMRDLFSSVFFVSIGMLIEIKLLLEVWPWILGLGVFVLLARAMATGLALILSGSNAHEARRASLLLGPLGEFSFIIAQLGVSTAVLPKQYYPIAVGVSIFTVLLMPLLNRFADPIVGALERAEPRWLQRTLEAYHGWFTQLQNAPTSASAWALVRPRLIQIGGEVLFITGVMTFSRQILAMVVANSESFGLAPGTLVPVFWGVVAVIVLIPLFAVWRNLSAVAMILAESVGGLAPARDRLLTGFKGIALFAIGFWLHAILPTDQLGIWGWIAISLAAIVFVGIFSNRLIYWHSQWQTSMRDVLAEDPRGPKVAAAEKLREQREKDLAGWDVELRESVVPDGAPYAGQSLAQLAIPPQFGCTVLEVERNGIVITAIRPDLRLYPGDRVLLLGKEEQTAAAENFLQHARAATDQSHEFEGSVLETFVVPEGPHAGRTLAASNIGQRTGARVVGIRRGDREIVAPSGDERLDVGDSILVAGTLQEIKAFHRWLLGQAAA
ncbi:cation:proton antiporter [Opitutus sp. ER46]|uniref:cation:proton antiporter n=1 Tax=Opitutus sp. ER46 TaxID=2161864 RepID=UPI000D307CCA|nr:cation:proton antiporter [Opitutus sp. ER46]PTX96645.1 sodium:proton exchanger [Opitutus sp. ER46]